MAQEPTKDEQGVINAVLYALREGCFFPVREPKPTAGIQSWVKWGAMRNLHRAVADYSRAKASHV